MQQESEKSSTEGLRNQWTPEQRINAGQLSAQTLNNPIFNEVHRMLVMKYQREIKLSEPKEDNLRRHLWLKERALDEVCLEMVQMFQEAQQIVAQRQAESDPAEKERQRLDEQGYGLNFNQQERTNG